jgi:hypothetical protein
LQGSDNGLRAENYQNNKEQVENVELEIGGRFPNTFVIGCEHRALELKCDPQLKEKSGIPQPVSLTENHFEPSIQWGMAMKLRRLFTIPIEDVFYGMSLILINVRVMKSPTRIKIKIPIPFKEISSQYILRVGAIRSLSDPNGLRSAVCGGAPKQIISSIRFQANDPFDPISNK